MKMPLLIVLGVCVLLASCGGRESAEDETQEGAAAGQSAAERTEQPSADTGDADREREPDDDDDAERDRVEVSAEVQERLGISVTEVREESLAISLAVAGSVQPIESRVARVRPLARGRVLEVRARIGDRVERGAELARFDNIEAGELAADRDAALAQLASFRAQLATVTRQAERTARLVEIGAVPQREHDANIGEQQQIEASIRAQESTIAGMEARLRRFETAVAADQTSIAIVRSPLSGIVTRVAAAPGDVVDSSSELFAVVDISRVYVQAQVFEKDLGRVREGAQARVSVDAYPDERFSGQVAVVGGVVDPRSRTVPVRVEVANPNSLLKLDMFARVDLATEAEEPGLAIPAEAVQTLEGRQVVFIRVEETEFAVRPVETGRSDGDLIEITRGLEAGESVVTGGAFKVKSALLAGELGDDDDEAQE